MFKNTLAKTSIKTSKNPWLARILNFRLPGLGYIYAEKKRMFVSYGFLTLSIVVIIYEWDEVMKLLSGKVTADFLLYIIIYPIVFAYDAYFDAMLFNKYIANKNKSN